MVAVVLMGAGASYGCGDVGREDRATGKGIGEKPPLGNGDDGLFSRLEKYKKLPERLPCRLRTLFKENFEAGMAKYFDEKEGHVMAFQRAIAGYLASFKPGEKCEYVRLVRSTSPEKVIFASLNYDLLLELSISNIGYGFNYNGLVAEGSFRVVKPHGSSNFWPMVKDTNYIGTVIGGNSGADVADYVVPLSYLDTIKRCETSTSFAPAMSMYAEGKVVKVCPDYVTSQQELWRAAVTAADTIYITGVRVHKSDTHIWDVLASCTGDVVYFGFGQGDEDDFTSWKDSAKKVSAKYIKGDFKKAVDIITAELK